MAALRQPAAALRLDDLAAGEETALHGGRVRAAARMESRPVARLASARLAAARHAAALGRGPEQGLSPDPGAARAGLQRRRLRVDRLLRHRAQRPHAAAQVALASGRDGDRGDELYAHTAP